MGKAKKKRKRLAKQKRNKKIKLGKLVRFDLQNCPKKLRGCIDRYLYQANMHNLIYKEARFKNVRFKSSNITECNFKSVSLTGVDFISSNLRGSNFSNAVLKDVVFFGCKLKDTIFKNTKFENVYFISTSINNCKDLDSLDGCVIINQYDSITLTDEIEDKISRLATCNEIYNPGVIHVNRHKNNYWIIKILLEYCGNMHTFNRVLNALCNRKNKRNFYTVYAYKKFIDTYLKR